MQQLAVDIGAEFGSPFGQTKELGDLVSIVLQAAIIIAGVITLFLFIFGGYSIISGAGQKSPERAAKGRQAITWAVIGFVLIFAAYWIIQILEAITGTTFLTAPGI